jgi:hypothetical protein
MAADFIMGVNAMGGLLGLALARGRKTSCLDDEYWALRIGEGREGIGHV